MKHLLLALILKSFILITALFAGGGNSSNTPTISISSSTNSFSIVEGTASVTLTLQASPAPNKNNIIVSFSNTCNAVNASGTIDQGNTSEDVTIDTSLYTPGTCSIVIISAIGGPSQNDGTISSIAKTATITITSPTNTPPVAVDDSFSTELNTSFTGNVLTNDTDAEGDTLTVITNTNPSNGIVTVNTNGGFTYTPTNGYLGTDSFTYTISDGNAGTDTATVTMTIYDPSANTPPNAVDDTYTTPFETDLSENVLDNDTDADGDTLTVTSNTSPTYGTVTVNTNGSFTYSPDIGYSGPDSFDYNISDGNGGTDSATVSITVETGSGFPTYDNTSVCGLFSNVLTTYEHLESNGNNDQVCNTEDIAYPNGEITGDIICHDDPACVGSGQSCQRVDPPASRYAHDFPDNNLSGSTTTVSSGAVLHDYNYGDINYGSSITLDPQTTYNGSSIKVMLLGHVVVSSGTLRLEPGDYYFDSLTFDGNNNDLILPSGGVVRIFVKGDLSVDMNNLSFNSDAGSSESNLFVYVAGNFESIGNGGGTTAWKAFMYVEGYVVLNNNSNNWKIYGGITAEGRITIDGNNPDFIGTGDGSNLGVADCVLCFEKPLFTSNGANTTVETQLYNEGGVSITDLNITKAYANNFSNGGSSIVSDTAGASSSYANGNLVINIEDLLNFTGTTKSGYVYTIGDYADDQEDVLFDTTNIAFDLEDYNTTNRDTLEAIYYANYSDGGFIYEDVLIERCGAWFEPTSITGPFDAWDTFRGDTNSDGFFDDKNISTKIAAKAFSLQIASLDSTSLQAETKVGLNADVTYGIYRGTTLISPEETFDANTSSYFKSPDFTVNSAYKNIHVGFKFCATYRYDEDYGDFLFLLMPTAACSGDNVACTAETTSIPKWHICYNSDEFANRPKEFTLTPPSGSDIELLTSGSEHNFTANAKNEVGANALDYNQTYDNIDISGTKLLKDGTEDTGDLLNGTVALSSTAFVFENGISVYASNNEAVGITFDDVAKVTLQLEDRNWAAVDSDDSPQDCNQTNTFGSIAGDGDNDLEDAYICGEDNATFIPHHFELEDVVLSNNRVTRPFTYLTWGDDLNISERIELKIIAKNANDVTTQNFKEGESTTYYENNMTVLLTVPTQDENGDTITNGNGVALVPAKQEIDTADYLEFGGVDADGEHVMEWDDSDLSQRIMFNYNKELNRPINPFNLDLSIPATSENVVTIDVSSTYNSSSGATIDITGDKNATGSAKFYFARIKASKDFYRGISTATAQTPISVLVYCDIFPTCSELNTTIQTSGQIDEPYWWLSLNHNENNQDGNITLISPPTVLNGAGTPTVDTDVSVVSQATDSTITVTANATSLPLTVGIYLDTSASDYTDTNRWLYYNPNGNLGLPTDPLYKVEFIGINGWSGVGPTGHVLETNASSTSTGRINW